MSLEIMLTLAILRLLLRTLPQCQQQQQQSLFVVSHTKIQNLQKCQECKIRVLAASVEASKARQPLDVCVKGK